MNLEQAIHLFMQSRKTFCTTATIRNYSNTLKYYKDFMIMYRNAPASDIDIRTIVLDDLNEYVIFLRNKKKNINNPFCSISDDSVTKRTIRTYCTDMKTFLNWALFNEYITNNPLKGFKLIRSEKKVVIPVSSDIMHIVDDSFNINTYLGCRNLAMIHCFIDSGLRVTEACNLRVKDVELNQDYLIVQNGKGDKGRVIPLSRMLKKYLVRLLDLNSNLASNSYYFSYTDGSRMTPNAIKNIFYRLKKKTEITDLYPHLLRHTFATSFLCGGGSLEMLKIYMGHTDIKVTENYLHMMNAIQFCRNIYQLDTEMFKRIY